MGAVAGLLGGVGLLLIWMACTSDPPQWRSRRSRLLADILVQAGAGVVAASSPDAEVAETVHKARAVLEAVAAAQGATLVIDQTGSRTSSRTSKEA